MAWFRRATEPVPSEVSFLDPESWARFTHVVEAAFRARRVRFTRSGTSIMLRCDGADVRTVYLTGFARRCRDVPIALWPDEAASFADSCCARGDFNFEHHPDRARRSLKVRLLPEDLSTAGSGVVRPVAESVVATVALDLPKAVRSVRAAELASIGLSIDAAFAVGYENVRREPPLNREEIVVDQRDDVRVVMLTSDSYFTATNVMWLEELILPSPESGALVSIPNRHTIVAHAIRDERVIPAIQTMIPTTRRLNHEGAGPLSAHVYWYRDGGLRWLPAYVDGTMIEFYPPEDFVEMLETL